MRRLSAPLAVALVLFATAAPAAEYTIDPSHAFIQFRVSHLGYSTLVGRFNTFEGDFTWDQAAPVNSKIQIDIETASVDSNWAERDKHLRDSDFLDVKKYPKATFRSTRWVGDASGGKLEGELTLHGVTKPIVLDVKTIGEGDDPWGGYRAGFSASVELPRADFGIDFDLGPAAAVVYMDLYVEGIRK